MSKPDKPGELRDVTVEAISLVSKAANGERFKIFKSAEEEPAPEVVKKDERGLFRILKEFFTKGEVAEAYYTKQSGRKLYEAFDALTKVLGVSRYGDETQTPETDSVKIVAALDDFRSVAAEILLGKTEVAKSGRKISGDRLGKLRNIQTLLGEVLSELDAENTSKEAEDLTKEEVQKTVDEAVKAVNVEEVVKKTVDEAVKAVNVEEVVKKAIEPILERLEKVENARGFSNRVPEDGAVEKSANDFWGGIF